MFVSYKMRTLTPAWKLFGTIKYNNDKNYSSEQVFRNGGKYFYES
jgi:hypothetical protein